MWLACPWVPSANDGGAREIVDVEQREAAMEERMTTMRRRDLKAAGRFTQAVAIAVCFAMSLGVGLQANVFQHLNDMSSGDTTMWMKIYVDGSAWGQGAFGISGSSAQCRVETRVDGGSAGAYIASGDCSVPAYSPGYENTGSWCGYVVAVGNFWKIDGGGWHDYGQGLGAEVFTLPCSEG